MRVIIVIFAVEFLSTMNYEMTRGMAIFTCILLAYGLVLDVIEAIGRIK